MPVAPLMQRFVDDELAGATALVERVQAGTMQLLREAHEGLGSAERALHAELAVALQQHGTRYRERFTGALKTRVHDELAGRRGAGDDAGDAFGGLTLMDESRVEIEIEISRALQLIDSTAEWQLRELQTFTSTLVGLDHVSADSNPLRPQVYAGALWDAACAVVESQVQRATLLRVSAGVAAGLLKNAWAAACTRLEAQGVEPGHYRTVVLTPGAGAGRASQPSAALATLLAGMPTSSTRPPGVKGARPESTGAAPFPGGGAGSGGPAAALEQVLRRLDELLRQLPAATGETAAALPPVRRLSHHRPALLAGVESGAERQVIELISRLYEAILSDPQLPPPWRAVLARLQVALLRVALRDAATMASHEHEIWRLLDRIGSASVAHPDAADPRHAALLACCLALAEDIAHAASPDAATFRQARQRLERFLAQQAQAQLQAAQPAVEALQRVERRELLEQQLGPRLAEQVAALQITPRLRRFLTGAWAKVLADVIASTGEASDETRRYLKATDELLWSLQVPDHPQSRQRLLALLPGLLQRLRDGLQRIERPLAEQQSVLDELMVIHTAALRPGASGQGGTLTAEQIVQRMRDEVVTEAPQPRAFSDSVVDLSTLQTVPAELMPTGAEVDDPAQRIEALRPAERLRVFLFGRWISVQLLWRSEHGLYFLFAGDAAGRRHSITRRALERLAGAGLIRPIEAKPLLQRAIDHLLLQVAAAA